MTNKVKIDDEKKVEDELLYLLDSVYLEDKVFSGNNQLSKIKGVRKRTGGFTPRYLTYFDGGFQFFGDFIDRLDRVIDDHTKKFTGYVCPNSEDIELFINTIRTGVRKQQIKRSVVNESEKTIKLWMKKNIKDIKDQRSNEKYRVKYITSKVGSGKSTFVDYLYKSNVKKLQDDNIYIVKIRRNQFNMNRNSDKTIRKHIINLITSACVIRYLKSIQNDSHSSIISDFVQSSATKDIIRETISDVLNSTIHKESEKSAMLDKIKCTSNLVGLQDNSCLHMFFKYISRNKGAKFFVIIDGFDELNPESVYRYERYINILKDIIYNDLHNETVYYLLTLRTCTYIKFTKSNANVKYLVPPSEIEVINHAINYVAKDNKYVNKRKDFFIDLFEIIYSKISEILNLSCHGKNLIEIFDYNHRFLLRYTKQIICFTFDRYTSGQSSISSFDEFIQTLEKDDFKNYKKFLNTKWYILIDILMLKNSDVYQHPYMLKKTIPSRKEYILKNSASKGQKNNNKDIVSFVDDIYNYIIRHNMVGPTSVFPLLIKFRILQLFQINGAYCDKEVIKSDLYKLGYNTLFYDSIIRDLHNAKLLKVTCKSFSTKNCNKEYKITNRGYILINEIALQTIYISHIAPQILLPKKNNSIMFYSQYLYKNTEKHNADLAFINNYAYFISVIRKIEEVESNKLNNEHLFNKIKISDRVHKNFILNLSKVLNSKRKRDKDKYEDNIKEIIKHIKDSSVSFPLVHSKELIEC